MMNIIFINCWHCVSDGRFGHTALRCWNRFDYSYQSQDIPKALATMSLWFAGSRYTETDASAHMTADAGNLKNITPGPIRYNMGWYWFTYFSYWWFSLTIFFIPYLAVPLLLRFHSVLLGLLSSFGSHKTSHISRYDFEPNWALLVFLFPSLTTTFHKVLSEVKH